MTWPLGYTVLSGLVGGTAGYAYGVSQDGTTVVGQADDSGGNKHAVYWTESTGPIDLGPLPGCTDIWAVATNHDGSVIVGTARHPDDISHCFRWTEATGMVDLTAPASGYQVNATGVSADGSIVVGYFTTVGGGSFHSFRWTEATGSVDLGVLPLGDGSFLLAFNVSSDGTTIVGESTFGFAMRWTEAEGIVPLDRLPESGSDGAEAASGNGSVIVGISYLGDAATPRAFRWTQADGMESLGYLPSGTVSTAFGITDNGAIVVGYGDDSTTQQRAFMWTQADGMVALPDLADVAPTDPYTTNSIAGNGSVIVGYAPITLMAAPAVTTAWVYGLAAPETTQAVDGVFGSAQIDRLPVNVRQQSKQAVMTVCV